MSSQMTVAKKCDDTEYTGNAFTRIDFGKQGRQFGYVDFPHSPHDDAWGVTRVPIAVLSNGDGPTIIFEGGNHGDEYEGPIAISELANSLDLGEINGRIILMPANNVHAVKVSNRVSPVDGLNMNRVFPGDEFGSITQRIAAYLTKVIFPMGDAFVDLHSGGSSLQILPSAIIEPTRDQDLHARNVAAARAFGAPYTVIVSNMGDTHTASATACQAGLVTVGTEMGGSGTVSLDALKVCRDGVRRLLQHFEVLQGTPPPPTDSGVLELLGPSSYVYAAEEGVFEPYHANGTKVSAGQPAGQVHKPWSVGTNPVELEFAADGIILGQRHPGRVRPGNCCAVVASPATWGTK